MLYPSSKQFREVEQSPWAIDLSYPSEQERESSSLNPTPREITSHCAAPSVLESPFTPH